jgi:lipopolysaccharide export system protein LptA
MRRPSFQRQALCCIGLGLLLAPCVWAQDAALDTAATGSPAATPPATQGAKRKLTVSNDREQPIHLSADRIEINQKKLTTLYIGHVRFTQGGLRIDADRVEALNRGNKLDTLTATGKPVTVVQRGAEGEPDLHAKAARVVYRALEQKLDLYEQAQIQQGPNAIEAAIMHYDLQEETLSADGGGGEGRVTVVIEPKTLEKTPAAGGAGTPTKTPRP